MRSGAIFGVRLFVLSRMQTSTTGSESDVPAGAHCAASWAFASIAEPRSAQVGHGLEKRLALD